MPEDTQMLLKLATLLVLGKIEEDCVQDAVTAVRVRSGGPPKKPIAYMQHCIAEWRTKRNLDPLGKLLVGVDIPAGLMPAAGESEGRGT